MAGMERIKQKLASDEVIIGTHVKWADNSITELFSMAGFDYIWIDGEHGYQSLQDTLNHIRAAQANGAAAFCRIPWNDPVRAKPILEMGPDALIFPFIRTREDAELAAASCHYPPKGVRGWAPGRAINNGLMSQDEYLKKAADIWVIAQIEHIDAVTNLDQILEVDGINGYIIGMSDLSSSMNILGQLANPELIKIIDEIAAKIKAKGKSFGTAAGFNERVLCQWIKRGGRLISIGGEEEFLCRQSRFVLGEMDKFIKENR
jgi:2-dehydro-3-deoxyglucarate aldolase/4-hydroxy-2-oxoheptanedioate aldolase